MSSIDMCEHDWPGSGCKECFPPKESVPGSWFDLGQIAHESCVSQDNESDLEDYYGEYE